MFPFLQEQGIPFREISRDYADRDAWAADKIPMCQDLGCQNWEHPMLEATTKLYQELINRA